MLISQLDSHGLKQPSTAECARLIESSVGPAAIASLFVDLGACNYLEGDLDAALASWRRAVVSGQPAPAARALLNLGLTYHHLQLPDRALVVLSSAVDYQIEPFSTQASLAMARCYRDSDNADQAVEILGRICESLMVNHPDSPLLGLALLELGELALQSGHTDRAEAAWKGAAANFDSEVRWMAGQHLTQLLISLGRAEQAAQIVESISNGESSLTPARQLRGAEQLIELDLSSSVAERLVKIEWQQLQDLEQFRFAEACISQKLMNEAIDPLEALLDHDLIPYRSRASYLLGTIYDRHEMVETAKEMYSQVIALGDDYWSSRAAMALGDALFDEDTEAAVSFWAQAASSPVASIRKKAENRLLEAVRPSTNETLSSRRWGGVIEDDPTTEMSLDRLHEMISAGTGDDRAAAGLSQSLAVGEPHVISLRDNVAGIADRTPPPWTHQGGFADQTATHYPDGLDPTYDESILLSDTESAENPVELIEDAPKARLTSDPTLDEVTAREADLGDNGPLPASAFAADAAPTPGSNADDGWYDELTRLGSTELRWSDSARPDEMIDLSEQADIGIDDDGVLIDVSSEGHGDIAPVDSGFFSREIVDEPRPENRQR